MQSPALTPDRFWTRHQRKVLFVVKSANLGLITIYQFLLIYVLTRTVGAEVYPIVVLLASIGNYILSTDLGFSGYVYALVRERFVRGGVGETHGFINAALNLYLFIPTVALIGAAFVIPATLHWTPLLLFGLVIYFASIIFSLPWQMVRSIMLAVDGFLLMESLEFVRRLTLVVLAAAMLAGLSFTGFAAGCVIAWVIAFGAAFMALRHHGIALRPLSPRQLFAFVAENRGKVARTGSFGAMEFVLYNFPYLLIPALGLGGHSLVFFDLFYKVTRFCGVAYNVPIETLLPFQTRAWHEGRKDEVRRIRWQMIGLCTPIFLAAAALLLLFGEQFFHLLLHDFPPVEPGLIHAMVAMMFLIMLQCTTGSFLVGIGRYETLVRVATAALGLSAAIALAGFVFRLSAAQLMVFYVVGYGVYAGIYRAAFSRLLRSSP
ncbi:hypothetical protein BH09PSE6_BH09PSE6_22750 [soil metagenome]